MVCFSICWQSAISGKQISFSYIYCAGIDHLNFKFELQGHFCCVPTVFQERLQVSFPLVLWAVRAALLSLTMRKLKVRECKWCRQSHKAGEQTGQSHRQPLCCLSSVPFSAISAAGPGCKLFQQRRVAGLARLLTFRSLRPPVLCGVFFTHSQESKKKPGPTSRVLQIRCRWRE